MPVLAPPPDSLLDGAALFLDFDGTLVELAETPAAIRVPPGLAPLLARLKARLDGRLAIVSGRALADLDRHIWPDGVSVSGSHGLETRLTDGTLLPLEIPDGMDEVRARVRDFASTDGLLVEDKPAGVALHYRQAPDEAEAARMFMDALAAEWGLTVQHGAMVAEVRAPGGDKGDAMRAFMAEPPFRGARPVFVGDDLTDEHAFVAAAELGGAGVLVGPMRETAARYRLASVAGVAEWLERAA